MAEIDELVRRTVQTVKMIADRAAAFATKVLLLVVIVCVSGLTLGVAALADGIQQVWIVLGVVFGAIAIGAAVVARWRVGAVRRHTPELADEVRALLIESGEWTALRTRPYSKVPAVDSHPVALFVTAMDTNPMAPVPEVVVAGREADFDRGLQVLSKLTKGATYLCVGPDPGIEQGVTAPVQIERFVGPHPSGTVGVHIHTLAPVNRKKLVWHVGYPDVVAIGSLFASGKLDVERIVSVGGPPVRDPRLVRTRRGADIQEVVDSDFRGESGEEDVRLIAGSVLSGKKAMGDVFGYLGRYDRQVSVVREGNERVLLGWTTPGLNAFSIFPIYLSKFFSKKRFSFSTTTNGSPRAMVPIGMYEDVMPLDILPTFLLRSLIVGDVEQAEKLGALELDEEDLALCTFVCPGKTNYGPILRANLEILEKEG